MTLSFVFKNLLRDCRIEGTIAVFCSSEGKKHNKNRFFTIFTPNCSIFRATFRYADQTFFARHVRETSPHTFSRNFCVQLGKLIGFFHLVCLVFSRGLNRNSRCDQTNITARGPYRIEEFEIRLANFLACRVGRLIRTAFLS